MPATQPIRRTRAPRGVLTRHPVLMRLLPPEQALLQHHARATHSTLSAFARRMTLAGLSQFDNDHRAKRVNGIAPEV